MVARGYKRKIKGLVEVRSESTWEEVGDEPLEIFRLTDNVRVYVDESKTVAAKRAADDGAEVIIIDDGFQHRKLHRDYDIVCLDWAKPFGNGHLLPLGLLREPGSHINRADGVIFTAYNQRMINDIDKSQLPQNQYYSIIRIENYKNLKHDEIQLPARMKDIRAIGFAGLGNSRKFKDSLCEADVDIIEFVAFPDHHHYAQADIDRLVKAARDKNATCLITTFKDAVKIDSYAFDGFDIYSAMPGLSIVDSAGEDRSNDLKAWLGL